MADTDNAPGSSRAVIKAVDRLHVSLMDLLQAQANAKAARVELLNPVALDLLTYHVGRLKILAVAQAEDEIVSAAVDEAIADVMSSTRALTAQRAVRPQ